MAVLVIGESLIDEIRRPDGTLIGSYLGGSPLNVAAGLGQLGRSVTLLTRIGTDEYGKRISSQLAELGVVLAPSSITDEPTSVAHAMLDQAGQASYTFDILSTFPRPNPDKLEEIISQFTHVHIGSVGAHLAPGNQTVREWVEYLRPHCTISYDPNVRLAIQDDRAQYQQQIEEYIGLVDIFKASMEDLAPFYGGRTADEIAEEILSRGPSMVVITDGAQGLGLYTRQHCLSLRAVDVEVVDTVGAGDALMSALIDGLARLDVLGRTEVPRLRSISRQLLTSLGTYSALAAAITVGRKGAHPPTRQEISQYSDYYSAEYYDANASFAF